MSGGGGHGGGGERWLISYADFITLLMVLFVVLYSMGQTDVKRYKQLAEGLRRAFGGAARIVDPSIAEAGGGNADTEPAPVTLDGFPQRSPDSLDVAAELTALLTNSGLSNAISVQNNIEGLLLSLSENLLFAPGRADLLPGAYPVLDKIAVMVNQIDNEVRVTAYTDNTPPLDPRYPTNWELSAARSAAIVRYLVERGLAPERLTAAGRGEYHPLFPNDTAEHRAFNRRAEIVVVYTVEEQRFALMPNAVLEQIQLPPAEAGGQPQP
ncbi:MAG: OmpA family protein [Chloroflexi bacterium]|nr:OmpA family protein [Chloroflexota bacterium]